MSDIKTRTTQQRLGTNESVMRALGIAHLKRVTSVNLRLIPGELPLLSIEMHAPETDPADHLKPPFNLQDACDAAMSRIKREINNSAKFQWADWLWNTRNRTADFNTEVDRANGPGRTQS